MGINIIGENGFVMVDKGMAEKVGLLPALIYGELVSTFMYWKDKNRLTKKNNKEWFFCTIDDLESKTTIKKDAQSSAINALEKLGLITTKLFGLPAKRYFHMTEEALNLFVENYYTKEEKEEKSVNKPRHEQLAEKPKPSIRENRKQVVGKSSTNKKELNKKITNNKQERESARDMSYLSESVKEFIKSNMNRFDTKNIAMPEVYKWLHDKHGGFTDKQLIAGLTQLLDNRNPIFSPYGFLTYTFNKIDIFIELQEKAKGKRNTPTNRGRQSRGTYEALVPEWFNDVKNGQGSADESAVPTNSEDIEERRRKLREDLLNTSQRRKSQQTA